MKSKVEIRREVSAAINAMDHAQRKQDDLALCQALRNLLQQNPELVAGNVLAYMPLPDEPGITPCFDGLDSLCLPQMLPKSRMCARRIINWKKDCIPGKFNVLEPDERLPVVDPAFIGLVIVPGRAFTSNGARLGRGKGYYDRFLSSCSPQAKKIALCYDCQLYPQLPLGVHDIPVDIVLTPSASY